WTILSNVQYESAERTPGCRRSSSVIAVPACCTAAEATAMALGGAPRTVTSNTKLGVPPCSCSVSILRPRSYSDESATNPPTDSEWATFNPATAAATTRKAAAIKMPRRWRMISERPPMLAEIAPSPPAVSCAPMVSRALQVERLRGVPLFARCTTGDLRIIARHLDVVEVSAGTEIVREGEMGDVFFVVLEGQAV